MKRVAVIGASTNRAKFGNKAVRAYLQNGDQVFPVNPTATEIEGLECYSSVREIAEGLDVVSVYVPPDTLLQLLPEIAEKKPTELWVNPGAESEEVITRASELGLNVVQACSIVGLGISPLTL